MDRQDEDIVQMPVWKSYLYHLQQQAPKPKPIICNKENKSKPPFYGREYHGAISREDAEFQLTIGGEGSYLIRESQRAPGQHTLAIRFDGATKNFKLYYDGQHYVGEKRFDDVNDLVADGLITYYLESKAADYIASLSNQSNYAESPYVAYNTHKKTTGRPVTKKSPRMGIGMGHISTPTSQIQNASAGEGSPAGSENGTASSGTAGSGSGESATGQSLSQMERLHLSQPADKPITSAGGRRVSNVEAGAKRSGRPTPNIPRQVSMPSVPQPMLLPRSQPAIDSADGMVNFNSSSASDSFQFSNSPCPVPSSAGQPANDGLSKQPVANKNSSSVTWCNNFMDVMVSEKAHNFKQCTFKGPHWCFFCSNFLWGLIAQGVKCQDCGFNAHKKCSEKVPNDCMPDMKHVKRIFGIDLTTIVKAQNSVIPEVVKVCVQEIESRGLDSEGLYRVAGFHDDIEFIRMSFDKDGDQVDISKCRYEDQNTITSVLKLYFRLLPIPLITFDVYFRIIDTMKRNELTTDKKLKLLTQQLTQLPRAHYHTLKYLIAHLHRVYEHHQQNMMNAENLAIIFAPTLLRSPETDPVFSFTAVRYEREFIELLIVNNSELFE